MELLTRQRVCQIVIFICNLMYSIIFNFVKVLQAIRLKHSFCASKVTIQLTDEQNNKTSVKNRIIYVL